MERKFVLLIVGITCWSVIQGQLQIQPTPQTVTIGTVKSGSYVTAQLTRSSIGKDTIYTLLFANAKYQAINDYQSIQFTGSQTIDDLRAVMSTFFTDEHKKDESYKVNLRLGDTDVILSNSRTMGVTSIFFWTSKGYFYLTEKQCSKLLGK